MRLPLFLLGLALGAPLGWFALRPSSSPTTLPPPSVELPAWSWRESSTPAPLTASSAASAIAAWLDLRAPDGTPAELATRTDTLRALLARLPTAEFPRLLTPLAARPGPDERQLLQLVFDLWVDLAPEAAARWTSALAGTPEKTVNALALQAVRAWAKLDPAAAITWACALPDEKRALHIARELLPSLVEQDPALALSLASASGEPFLDKLLPALLAPLAKTDPGAALRVYGPRIWKNGEGHWQLRDSLGKWATADPHAAVSWLLAQPRRSDSQMSHWLGDLAQISPNRAAIATALATIPDVPNRQAALGNLFSQWSSLHPTDALAWLDTLTDRHLRTVLLGRAAQTTYSDDPRRSIPLALAMPQGTTRTNRLSRLLGTWAATDPDAALAWIRQQTDPDVATASTGAYAAILGSIARDEPDTAVAEWNALPEGPIKSAALATIGETWATAHPAAALQWLATHDPRLDERVHSYTAMIYAWSRQDPVAALRWAEARTQDYARQSALQAIGGNWHEKANRATIADLYTQIADPGLRTKTLTRHLAEWLTKDRATASAWLDSNNALSPDQAAALLKSE